MFQKAASIKVSVGHLRSPSLHNVMLKVDKADTLPTIQTVRKAAHISACLKTALVGTHNEHMKLVLTHSEKDDNGALVARKDDKGRAIPNTFIIKDEAIAAWNADMQRLMNTELEMSLEYGKFKIKELAALGLTPEDYATLSFLVDR